MTFDNLLFLITVLWIIRLSLNLTFHIQRWYIKEYRLDRMFIYLKQNPLRAWFFPQIQRMRISPKTVLLYVVSSLMLFIIGLLIKTHILIRFLFLDLTQFGVITLCVYFVNIPTHIFHKLLIYKAVRKLRKFPNLKVIGITGSFGKTSTKEILKTLLSTKYKILTTVGSKNSPIGIAEVILKYLKPEHQIFIVEMGAYKRGEIKEICDIVHPQMGIVTGINEQHIELFGSIANTRKAKYELVESIPKGQKVFFNADNEYTRLMAKQTRDKEIILYGTHKTAQVKITEISQTTQRLTVTLLIGKHKIKGITNLLGKHYAVNIAAAIAVAYHLNLSIPDIQNNLTKLKPFSTGLQKAGMYHGATLIDDTFNANPDSVKAAVDYLTLYKERKFLVLTPLIELGNKAKIIHFELGKYILQYIDDLILTNPSYIKEIRHSAQKSNRKLNIHVLSANKTVSYLRKNIKEKDAVIFVGKEAFKSLKKLKEHE